MTPPTVADRGRPDCHVGDAALVPVGDLAQGAQKLLKQLPAAPESIMRLYFCRLAVLSSPGGL